MQTRTSEILTIIIVTTIIILLLGGLIITLIYLYKKKQLVYHENVESLKLDYERNLLKAQVEIQENTFENISREIHDNINLSLTLAKLNLNTINLGDRLKIKNVVDSSVELLSKAINDLSDISKSMSPEIISNQGLINTIEREVERIRNIELFKVTFVVSGNPIFLEAQKELIIFRIVQESLNNIIKHAKATLVNIILYYGNDHLDLTIQDDGNGFNTDSTNSRNEIKAKSGLNNIKTRAKMFNGDVKIWSEPGNGTNIFVTIPFN